MPEASVGQRQGSLVVGVLGVGLDELELDRAGGFVRAPQIPRRGRWPSSALPRQNWTRDRLYWWSGTVGSSAASFFQTAKLSSCDLSPSLASPISSVRWAYSCTALANRS